MGGEQEQPAVLEAAAQHRSVLLQLTARHLADECGFQHVGDLPNHSCSEIGTFPAPGGKKTCLDSAEARPARRGVPALAVLRSIPVPQRHQPTSRSI